MAKTLLSLIPWWGLQACSMFLLYSTQAVFRKYGLCAGSYIYYLIICVGFVGWVTPIVIMGAGNNLFRAHFLGIAYLFILGFLGSLLLFREYVSLLNVLGAILIVIGGVFLIIK